jgi:hypothetical protein
MKYFRMKIQNIRTGATDTYVSKRQGAAPSGWRCIGVLGCYEKPGRDEHDEQEQEDENTF